MHGSHTFNFIDYPSTWPKIWLMCPGSWLWLQMPKLFKQKIEMVIVDTPAKWTTFALGCHGSQLTYSLSTSALVIIGSVSVILCLAGVPVRTEEGRASNCCMFSPDSSTTASSTRGQRLHQAYGESWGPSHTDVTSGRQSSLLHYGNHPCDCSDMQIFFQQHATFL